MTNEELLKKINGNPCGNIDMVKEHIEILALIPSMHDDIKLMRKKLIDGNGDKSLITKHDLLASTVANHLINHKEHRSMGKWLIGLCVALLICFISTGAGIYIALRAETKSIKIEEVLKIKDN